MKYKLTVPLVAMAFLAVGPAFAGHWLKELNLTDAQKKSIEEIKAASKKGEGREKIKEARESLDKALQGNASDDELRKAFQKLEGLHAEKAKERFETLLKIRKVLTPEQRAKFKMHMGGPGPHGRMGKGRKFRKGPHPKGGGDDSDEMDE